MFAISTNAESDNPSVKTDYGALSTTNAASVKGGGEPMTNALRSRYIASM